MLVWLTRSAAVATFQEKRGKRYQVWIFGEWRGGGKGRPLVTAENKLRTIIERENMLPHCARRAQQQIRLHEVTRTQWRRLALEFYKKQRVSKKARWNICVACTYLW
jgi:hypothetical protein